MSIFLAKSPTKDLLHRLNYIRSQMHQSRHYQNSVKYTYVIGKARNVPIERMTFPNLERKAALYGSKLALIFSKMKCMLELINKIFWFDFTTILYWLQKYEIQTCEILHC